MAIHEIKIGLRLFMSHLDHNYNDDQINDKKLNDKPLIYNFSPQKQI